MTLSNTGFEAHPLGCRCQRCLSPIPEGFALTAPLDEKYAEIQKRNEWRKRSFDYNECNYDVDTLLDAIRVVTAERDLRIVEANDQFVRAETAEAELAKATAENALVRRSYSGLLAFVKDVERDPLNSKYNLAKDLLATGVYAATPKPQPSAVVPERQFPIITGSRNRCPGFPASIPWAFISPHERQAKNNHDQTLEKLAERGGLDWSEAFYIINDRPWEHGKRLSETEHAKLVVEAISKWRTLQHTTVGPGLTEEERAHYARIKETNAECVQPSRSIEQLCTWLDRLLAGQRSK